MPGGGWLVGENDNYETYSNRKDNNDNHNDKVYFTSDYYDCRGTSPGIMVTRARGRLGAWWQSTESALFANIDIDC